MSIVNLKNLVALALATFVAGCGNGDKYQCNAESCTLCDSMGCRTVQPPTPVSCQYANDPVCGSTQTCTSLGCLTTCTSDTQCEQGNVCKSGLCTAPSSSPTVVQCTLASDCPASNMCVNGACVAETPCTGNTCTCNYSTDCAAGKVCANNQCVPSCTSDANCTGGLVCNTSESICVSPTTATCGGATGVACPAGESCVNGACTASCSASAATADAAVTDGLASDASSGGCASGQICQAGVCVNDTQREVVNCVDGEVNPQNSLQKCFDSLWRYTCTTSQACKTIEDQLVVCSATQGYCQTEGEANPQCTQASDCASGMACVSNACVAQ